MEGCGCLVLILILWGAFTIVSGFFDFLTQYYWQIGAVVLVVFIVVKYFQKNSANILPDNSEKPTVREERLAGMEGAATNDFSAEAATSLREALRAARKARRK